MSQSNGNILWLDMEMSGLDVRKERVLEIAALVTNAELEILETGPEIIVHQPDSLLEAMDEWNREHHGKSGLTARVRSATTTEEQAEAQLLAFAQRFGEKRTLLLAGNSIHQDRKFLEAYLPKFEAYLHYRNLDVSTVKELARRWYPTVFKAFPKKKETHRALSDIQESIAELQYYRSQIFQ